MRNLSRRLLFVSIVVSALAASTSTASAATIVFTDRAAWEAAVGTFETETFDGVAAGALPTTPTTVGLLTVTADFGGAIVGAGDLNLRSNLFGVNELLVGFPLPVLAFGADFLNIIDASGVQVSVAGDVFQLHDHIAGASGFFGVISTSQFSSVLFSQGNLGGANEVIDLDDVSFSSVPEPATMTLVGLGFGAVAARRRLRRRG
jgi:hypothetical protein